MSNARMNSVYLFKTVGEGRMIAINPRRLVTIYDRPGEFCCDLKMADGTRYLVANSFAEVIELLGYYIGAIALTEQREREEKKDG